MRQVFRFPFPDFRVGCGVTVFPSGSYILRLLIGLVLFAGQGSLRADIESPKTQRVPVAKPAKAVAVRGFPVEIRLEGTTSTTRMLQFIPRQMPKHGRLEGPPVQAGKDNAVVRYTGDPASKAEADVFTFATKVEGSGSSEEASVTIRLVDPAPVLEAAGGVDLSRVLAGELVVKPLTITNKGNAPWQGTVPLPAGWTWQAPAGGRFDLAPGDRIESAVGVRVADPGEIDEIVTLRPGATVRFIGKAIAPFLAYPTLLRLQWDPVKRQRAWRLNLRNNTGQPMTVRLSGPPGLVMQESVIIPAVESQETAVGWSGNVSQATSGEIRLEAPGWHQLVKFEALVAPATVELTGAAPDGTVDFGVLEKAEGVKSFRTISLKNAGGVNAVIRWEPLRLFVLEGMDREMVLVPGAERHFTLRPGAGEPGRLKEELLLRMNGGDRLLKLTADIDPAAAKAALMQGTVLEVKPVGAPASIEGSKASSENGLRLRTQILSGGLMEGFPNKDLKLPAVDSVRMIEVQSDRLVFEWPAPGPGQWTYHIMVKALRNHGLQQAPIPEYGKMDNVKVVSTPTGGRAEVTGLRPNMWWFCRIVSVRSDGISTKAGGELKFLTAPAPDSRWGWRLLGALGVIALVLYVRQKWREDVKWKD